MLGIGQALFPGGLSLFSNLSRSPYVAAGVFQEEKGESCKALRGPGPGTHILSLLCSTGQSNSRGRPASSGRQVVEATA